VEYIYVYMTYQMVGYMKPTSVIVDSLQGSHDIDQVSRTDIDQVTHQRGLEEYLAKYIKLYGKK